jgi:phage repressor protein C with HTH and peptisase S24 domain
MSPTLRNGDAVLTRWTDRVRPGQVVLAEFDARPGLLVVKRAVREVAGGWWLLGDNPAASDDSRSYGPGRVVARVLWRYWPRPWSGRLGRSAP